MPITPTYPGVYIEEIPSGVHTITGVATSIAAFIGYTEQGPLEPVHIFSMADYERAFGGLTVDSPLSYAVNQFFQNGGSEAYVVRVANGATSAMLTLNAQDGTGAIAVTAANDGTAGNFIQLDIDYNTSNPDSLFNLIVTQFVNRNGQMVPGTVETFRNLSMSQMNPNYFKPIINGSSNLVTVDLAAGQSFTGQGSSQTGTLPSSLTSLSATQNRVAMSLDGGAPLEFSVFSAPQSAANLAALLTALQPLLQPAIDNAFGALKAKVTVSATALTVTSASKNQQSAVRFTNASSNDLCNVLKLGVANGGIEVEGAASGTASRRPLPNGTLGAALPPTLPVLVANGKINIDVFQAGASSSMNGTSMTLQLWTTAPTTVGGVLTAMRAAFGNPPPTFAKYLAGTTVEVDTLLGSSQLRIVPGFLQGNIYLKITDSGDGTSAALMLNTPAPPPPPPPIPSAPDSTTNFNHYVLGSGTGDANVPWVSAATPGNNGIPPNSLADYGDPLAKTGIYSLDNVDLFNIMCLPDVASNYANLSPVYPAALEYCKLRRAMLILDTPMDKVTIDGAQTWLSGLDSGLISSNAAAYFPPFLGPDPLRNNIVHAFPDSGAMAGIWARTDASRGVWKAPAGTEAQIAGATGLAYRMNDQENGILNPLGLNCLRTFPVYLSVVWGARTMRGADALDDDYKYVPVRRLALFLEESLYRGTQWVVFEPNDEPLWAQIRLTVGSFMHYMFRQGAFAGQTPQVAYFVKCDSETTTPLDQDQGRVNIIVGFAPLRPAEFVILQIQQIVSVGPT